MTKIPETPEIGETGALGARRPFGWLDVVLTCGLIAAILLVVLLGILVAAANDMGPFAGDSLAAVSISLLLLEPAAIFVGIYVMLIRIRGYSWSDLGLRAMRRSWVSIALLGAIACLGIAGGITQIFDQFYPSPMINEYANVLIPADMSVVRAALILLCVGGLVPVAEELLFRGVLYGWLRQRWGIAACTIISSALFTMAHANFRVAVQIFITGAVLALLYEYSRSILAPIIAHMAVNTTSLVILFIYAGSRGVF